MAMYVKMCTSCTNKDIYILQYGLTIHGMYDDEIHMAKLAKRKAEKQARTSGLTMYEEIYTFHPNLVNCLLDKKKQRFF